MTNDEVLEAINHLTSAITDARRLPVRRNFVIWDQGSRKYASAGIARNTVVQVWTAAGMPDFSSHPGWPAEREIDLYRKAIIKLKLDLL